MGWGRASASSRTAELQDDRQNGRHVLVHAATARHNGVIVPKEHKRLGLVAHSLEPILNLGDVLAQKSRPICISVINMKGGVGKTTIAVSLARTAAQRWRQRGLRDWRVLAIDLDPQANLSQALMGEASYRQFLDSGEPSIAEVFDGYQPPTSASPSATPMDASAVLRSTNLPNLHVLPSRFDFADRLISAVRPDPRCLARLIAERFQDENLIIIDCAPTESIFTQAAYHASRHILVPVRPEYFATIGFPLLRDSLRDFRRRNRGHKIRVIGVVVNDAGYRGSNDGGPERWRSLEEITEEATKNRWHIFDNHIAYSRGFPKIMRGDTSYPGSSEVVMRRFADEFFTRPGLKRLGLGKSP